MSDETCDDLQNKSLSRPLTAKKGYNYVVRTSGYLEGQWDLTSKLPTEIHVLIGNSGNFLEIGNCVAKVLVFYLD